MKIKLSNGDIVELGSPVVSDKSNNITKDNKPKDSFLFRSMTAFNTVGKNPLLDVAKPAIQKAYKSTPDFIKNPIETGVNALPTSMSITASMIPGSQIGSGTAGAILGERMKQRFGELTGKEQLTPEQSFKNYLNEGKSALIGEGVGLAAKGVGAIARQTVGSLGLIDKVKNAFVGVKQNIGKTFDEGIKAIEKANPNSTVNLFDDISEISHEIAFNPEIMSVIKSGEKNIGDNIVTRLINNPELAKNLSLSEARSVRQVFEKSTSIASKLSKKQTANWTPAESGILDKLTDIKSKIVSSFPEITSVNKEFSDAMYKYNVVKPFLKIGKMENALTSKEFFNNKEIYNRVIKPLLAKDPQLLREMGSYSRWQDFGNRMAAMATSVIGAGALYMLGNKIKNATTGKNTSGGDN